MTTLYTVNIQLCVEVSSEVELEQKEGDIMSLLEDIAYGAVDVTSELRYQLPSHKGEKK